MYLLFVTWIVHIPWCTWWLGPTYGYFDSFTNCMLRLWKIVSLRNQVASIIKVLYGIYQSGLFYIQLINETKIWVWIWFYTSALHGKLCFDSEQANYHWHETWLVNWHEREFKRSDIFIRVFIFALGLQMPKGWYRYWDVREPHTVRTTKRRQNDAQVFVFTARLLFWHRTWEL